MYIYIYIAILIYISISIYISSSTRREGGASFGADESRAERRAGGCAALAGFNLYLGFKRLFEGWTFVFRISRSVLKVLKSTSKPL